MKTDSTLTRIAAANPYSTPAAEPDETLFQRIVALPRERRRGPRRRVVVAVVFAAAAVLASSAVAVDKWLTGAVKPDVTLQEYRTAQAVLPLPPGAAWPTLHLDPNSLTSRGGGGGFAIDIAMTKWECYWAAAIRNGDAAAQHRSQQALRGLLARIVIVPDGASEDWTPANPPAFPYAKFADDGGYQFKQRIYARAATGDATGVAQSCRANS
jgi:hypothetical protein